MGNNKDPQREIYNTHEWLIWKQNTTNNFPFQIFHNCKRTKMGQLELDQTKWTKITKPNWTKSTWLN